MTNRLLLVLAGGLLWAVAGIFSGCSDDGGEGSSDGDADTDTDADSDGDTDTDTDTDISEDDCKRKLKDVFGCADNDVFAVGTCGIVLHFDGDKWTDLSMDSEVDITSGFCAQGGDVYLAGGVRSHVPATGTATCLNANSGGMCYSMEGRIYTLNSDKWEIVFESEPVTMFDTIHGYDADYIVATGKLDDGLDSISVSSLLNEPRSLLMVAFNGTTWVDRLQEDATADSLPDKVWVTPTETWGINNSVTVFLDGEDFHCEVMRFDGTTWDIVHTLSGSCFDLFGTEDNNLFIAMAREGIAHLDTGVEQEVVLPDGVDYILAVHGVSSERVVAVGMAGTIVQLENGVWTTVSVPSSLAAVDFEQVWITDTAIVVAGTESVENQRRPVIATRQSNVWTVEYPSLN